MSEALAANEISLADVWRWVWPNRTRILVGGLVGGLAVALTLFFFVARNYTVNVSFVPQVGSAGGLGGLAAQLGLSLPASDVAQNPLFYSKLLDSEGFLRGLVSSKVATDRDSIPLFIMLGVKGKGLDAERRAVLKARKAIAVSADTKTGVVAIGVTTPDSVNSRLIAGQVLRLVDDFNERIRRSRAKAQREFAAARVNELKHDLETAEERLRAFRERNREIRFSPELILDSERLTREVARIQGVYLSVSQAYEQARLEEVHETPVVTVLEPARTPLSGDPRGLAKKSILGAFLGAAIGLLSGIRRRPLVA